MTQKILRIATRNSPLALWQANHIRTELLRHWPHLQIELLPMRTSGDKFLKDKLLSVGGKGLFVKELEEALLDHRADFAVHSMKDVPVAFPAGLCLTAICQRHNPYDAFVSNIYPSLQALPQGSIVGTTSLRRQSLLLAHYPKLSIKPLRGNIHRRIQKMQAGEYDGIILAAAGLQRMAMAEFIKEIIAEEIMLPAPGQGALGIECRAHDEALQKILAPLNDPLSALCVQTERHVNASLGGNCHTPVAIFCKPRTAGQLLLQAKIATLDGRTVLHASVQGHQDEASALAEQCTQTLLAKGALELLNHSAHS